MLGMQMEVKMSGEWIKTKLETMARLQSKPFLSDPKR